MCIFHFTILCLLYSILGMFIQGPWQPNLYTLELLEGSTQRIEIGGRSRTPAPSFAHSPQQRVHGLSRIEMSTSASPLLEHIMKIHVHVQSWIGLVRTSYAGRNPVDCVPLPTPCCQDSAPTSLLNCRSQTSSLVSKVYSTIVSSSSSSGAICLMYGWVS